jgi:hypothetical protein
MKTLDEVKQYYEERQETLRREKAEALKITKARIVKAAAAQKLRLRKQDAHIKIIIGGYMLAEIKEDKNIELLEKIEATLQSEKDKELFKDLASTL